MKKIFILLLVLSLILCSCVSREHYDNENNMNVGQKNKIIATWITYQEINTLVEEASNENEFRYNVREKIDILKQYKINTVFLHVRAFDDCFYKSTIFPVSEYCDSEKGVLKFDVLQVFLDICSEFNIKLHAWLNPYRIRNNSDIGKINEDSFAFKLVNNDDTEKIIVTNNGIYYNPAYYDIQSYILRGVKEILENYSVDGIHIDDYFYPTTSDEIDKNIFTDYQNNGGVLNLDEFRRQNVNSLITSIYSLIKSYNEDICFSVSPNGDISKNVNVLYADVKLWMNSDGYADYVIPQLYFGYFNENMSFKTLLEEWIDLCNDKSKLIIGLGIYKSGKKDIYAKSGESEWIDNSNIIARQIKDSFDNSVTGISIFSFSYLISYNDVEVLNNEKRCVVEQLEIYDS